MSSLHVIQDDVRLRAEKIASAHGNWPCCKGCDDCCRRLASVPIVTQEEWRLISTAIDTLPTETATLVRRRILDSAGLSRPVVCPMLDTGSGTCLIYEARPVACRAYGFYVERQNVLGCDRIESIAQQSYDVVWGNHEGLEGRLGLLGPAVELHRWLSPENESN